MKIYIRFQGAKGPRGQVKGVDVKPLNPRNLDPLNPIFELKADEIFSFPNPFDD
jgi:hypothetical protein